MDEDFKGKALGAILLQSQMITPEQIEEALKEQKRTGVRLGEALVSLGIVSQEDVHWGLSQQKSFSFVRINPEYIDPAAIRAVPAEVARRHVFLPYLLIGDELTIVIDDPGNQAAVTELAEITGRNIVISIGMTDEIQEALDHCYGKDDSRMITVEPVGDFFSADELGGLTRDHTGEAFLAGLLSRADDANVDEIHFESGKTVDLRLRRGDHLSTVARIGPAWMHLVSRRLTKITRETTRREGLERGFLEQDSGGGTVTWHVTRVDAVDGETIRFHRIKAGPEPQWTNGVETSTLFRDETRGLFAASGPDCTEKQRHLKTVADSLVDLDRKVIYLGTSPYLAGAGLVRMQPDTGSPGSWSRSLDAAAALNPDVLIMDELPERDVLDRLLRMASGRLLVILTVSLGSPRAAMEYIVETAGSRTMVGETLRGLLHFDVLGILSEEDRTADDRHTLAAEALGVSVDRVQAGTLSLAPSPRRSAGKGTLAIVVGVGPDVVSLIKTGAPALEVGEAVRSACLPAFREALMESVLQGRVALDDLVDMTGSKDRG